VRSQAQKKTKKLSPQEIATAKAAFAERTRPEREAAAAQHLAIVTEGRQLQIATNDFTHDPNREFFFDDDEQAAKDLYIRSSAALDALDKDVGSQESLNLAIALQTERKDLLQKARHASFPFALEHFQKTQKPVQRSDLEPVFPALPAAPPPDAPPLPDVKKTRPGSRNILSSPMTSRHLHESGVDKLQTMAQNLGAIMAQFDLAHQKCQTDYAPPTAQEIAAASARIVGIKKLLKQGRKEGRRGKHEEVATGSSATGTSSASDNDSSSSSRGSHTPDPQRLALDVDIMGVKNRLVMLYERRYIMDQASGAAASSAAPPCKKTSAILIVDTPVASGSGDEGISVAFGEPYPSEIRDLLRAMHGKKAAGSDTTNDQRKCATCVLVNL
jgi:hypothetical protein